MAPQRYEVPIPIVTVNYCIDHIDCLDIMADDLKYLLPHVLIFLTYSSFFLISKVYKNEQVVIVHFLYIAYLPNVDQLK